jgi:hypothetical protein
MTTVKKIIDGVCLAADLAPAVGLVLVGLGLIVGGSTGALWY